MDQVEYLRGAIDPRACVSGAWELVLRRVWLYVGMGVVTMLLIGCIPFISSFLFGPVMAGFYYCVLRDMRGEDVEFGYLFKGFEKFVPLMVVGLVESIPGIIWTLIQYTADFAQIVGGDDSTIDVNFFQSGSEPLWAGLAISVWILIAIFVLFGIVWNVSLQFALPLMLERDISIGDALLTSVKAAFGNIGGLVGLIIFQVLVMLLGLVALCIGIFVAFPIVYASVAFAYRQVFPELDRSRFETGPPPPDAYNFGSSV